MKKDALLKCIAETGYNVGFGGRKHWATYDIVDKVPGLIGFFSTAMGVFALVYDSLSAKDISAALVVLGVIGLYISFYDSKKSDYEKAAKSITRNSVSYTHLTLPTIAAECRSRWSPYH